MQRNKISKYIISVNRLADFTRSSEKKKKTIVLQQKDPSQVVIATYIAARSKMKKFIAGRGDISNILSDIEELKTKNIESTKLGNDRQISLEALERVVKLKLPKLLKDLDSYEVIKFPFNSFIFSGINIIVSPDVIIKGFYNGKTYIGAIKFHISKSAPFSIIESEYVATTIYNYLNSFIRQKDVIILPELCLSIDAFAETVVSTPKNIEEINLKLSEYCHSIKSIWDNYGTNIASTVKQPKYSKTDIKKCGNILKQKELFSGEQIKDAENKLTYWRTVHSLPLSYLHEQTYIIGLSDYESLISKRIKRSASIINKLQREKSTNLTTMQDLAGYRIILPTIEEVYHITNLISLNENPVLELQTKYTKDYIEKPKKSGYRGIHLIFRYKDSDYIDGYDYLNLELQIRSRLQHIWATAVETAGIFKGFSLKANEGPNEWLEFFKLASAAFSIYENCPKNIEFEGIPDLKIITSTVEQFKELEVEKILKGVAVAFEHIKEKKYESESYNLVTLNLDKRVLNVKNFKTSDLEAANNAYTDCERRIEHGENLNVVLVSTNSIKELQEAYPSYFGDANEFINKIFEIEKMIENVY